MPTGAAVHGRARTHRLGRRRHVSRRSRLQRRLGRRRRQRALRGFGRGQDAPRRRRLLGGRSHRRRRGRRYLWHGRRNRRGRGTGRRRGRLDRGRRNLGRRQEEQADRGIPADPRPAERRDRRTARSARRRRSGRRRPTSWPSATVAPRSTENEPRWTSVTESLCAVSSESVLPPAGTVPAKVTVASNRRQDGRARRRADRDAAVLSREPWGSARRSRRAEHGALHGPATSRAQWRVRRAPRQARMATRDAGSRRCLFCKPWPKVPGPSAVVKSGYSETAVERVSRDAGQARDELRRLLPARGRPRRAPRPRPAPRARRRQPRPRPSTSVTSPRGGSANRSASSESVPRATSS